MPLLPMGFVYKVNGQFVVRTGAKHRLMAAVVDLTTRKPSHLINRVLSQRLMKIGLRLANVPARTAQQVSQQWAAYMEKSIDAQCDALVAAPFGKKIREMFLTGFSEELIAEAVIANEALLGAIEEARST